MFSNDATLDDTEVGHVAYTEVALHGEGLNALRYIGVSPKSCIS